MEVNLTETGFRAGDTEYWKLETAAALIGLHPQSLQRLYRYSGTNEYERQALKLGRTLFFNSRHLKELGYPIKKKEEEYA